MGEGMTAGPPPTGDLVGVFESIVENPISRIALKWATSECAKDHGKRIEVGLELSLGIRKKACASCQMTSYLVRFLVKKGSQTFGVSDEELKRGLLDSYWRRGLVNVVCGIADFGVKKPFVPGAPFQVVWNITRACNLKCRHCYESAGRKGEDELTDEQVMAGIEKLAQANISSLAFSGGEPTLHPSILKFIKTAHDDGIYVSIATNGYRFSDRDVVRRYKEAGLGFVQVSLDGSTPEVHDDFRGVEGSWKAALLAIKNCLDEDLTVCVSTTVTKANMSQIPEMLEFAIGLGLKWYMLYNFIPTGRGATALSLDLSPHDRKKILEMALQYNGRGMQVLSTAPQYASIAHANACKDCSTIPTHFYNPTYSNEKMNRLADFIGGCGAGRFYVAVEPNGDVYPCVFFPHDPELRLGNLMEMDFLRTWKTNGLLSILRNKDALEGHCPRCENRYICGGCRARAYAYFHDIRAPDPGCENNEECWARMKEEEAERIVIGR